jgi:hypothetical protein
LVLPRRRTWQSLRSTPLIEDAATLPVFACARLAHPTGSSSSPAFTVPNRCIALSFPPCASPKSGTASIDAAQGLLQGDGWFRHTCSPCTLTLCQRAETNLLSVSFAILYLSSHFRAEHSRSRLGLERGQSRIVLFLHFWRAPNVSCPFPSSNCLLWPRWSVMVSRPGVTQRVESAAVFTLSFGDAAGAHGAHGAHGRGTSREYRGR